MNYRDGNAVNALNSRFGRRKTWQLKKLYLAVTHVPRMVEA